MAIEYNYDEKLKRIAEKVIAENENLQHLDSPDVRIAFQMSSQEKRSLTKITYADTEKVKDKLKLFLPYDFIITFYKPNIENLTDDKLERLMYHELLHVGVNEDGRFFIIPHDIEDFRDVIDRWGVYWL